MAVVVGTDSYGDEAGLDAHALKYGITIALPTGSTQTLAQYKSTLLYGSMDYLETRPFIGSKTVSTQSLQFPRYGIVIGGYEIDSASVPADIIKAQYIGAMLIYAGDDLQPVVGQAIKRKKVDVLETEYQDNTTGTAQFTALNDILRPFINGGIRGVRV